MPTRSVTHRGAARDGPLCVREEWAARLRAGLSPCHEACPWSGPGPGTSLSDESCSCPRKPATSEASDRGILSVD